MTPKIHITTTLDSRLKELFDKTQSIHGCNISALLDEKMFSFLKEYCQVEVLDLEILQKEQELQELREMRDTAVYALKARQEEEKKKQIVSYDPVLEDMRCKKFNEHVENIRLQLSKGHTPNWERLAPMYQFADAKQFREWFFERMNTEGMTI